MAIFSLQRHHDRRNKKQRSKRGGRVRPLSLEPLEARRLLIGGYLQNVAQPMDVNDDERVTPLDVLICINEMNMLQPVPSDSFFMDVNGDGDLTTFDPLEIINYLNHKVGPADFYSADGSGNNEQHSEWGQAGTKLLRMAKSVYADGISEPSGADRPAAREISNAVFAQLDSELNERQLTDMVWQWGQFLDHDLDFTPGTDPAEPLTIPVPQGDPWFDPQGLGDRTIGFNRSIYDAEATGPRQQFNQITAWLDGSQVYGSDAVRAAALRTHEGGRMRTSDGDLLPYNTDGLPNDGGPRADLFVAGDFRANEQVGLTAMHTLFVREHNRVADEIAAANPSLSDEQIYQLSRRQVIAILQVITYNEFLPALLGAADLPAYEGYEPSIQPGIANMFSTAAYRFGHSMLSPQLMRLDADGQEIPAGHLPLRHAFFAPHELQEHGIDPILRGLTEQLAQEIDAHLIDDVRNFLFGPPGSGGFDLASLNIQRGRDHGLASYNEARAAYGLAPVTDFNEITSNAALAESLQTVYGSVDRIDAWVGGLAEDHLPDSSVGPFVAAVLRDQFHRLRAADRNWYQRSFQGAELASLESTTLSDVLQRNSGLTDLAGNVFFKETV